MRRISVLLLFCVWFLGAEGQDTLKVFRLGAGDLREEVQVDGKKVTAASRTMVLAGELPVTVYVVTREEILANGYVTLADVLKEVPGVRVSQPGSATEGELFMIRGLLGNYYTKILIDDVPVQPSGVAGMPVGGQLPVRQAERIEIILGPAGAVYGADALAGVINIVTLRSERPVYAHADIFLGTLGHEGLAVTIGGKAGKGRNILDYRIFGTYNHRDDMKVKYDIGGLYDPSLYDTTLSYLSAPYYRGDTFSPEMDDLLSDSRMIGFGLNFRGLRLDAINMERSVHSSIGRETSSYHYYNPGNRWGENITRVVLGYEKQAGKVSTTTNASYLRYRLDERTSLGLIRDLGVGGQAYKYAASDDIFLEEVLTWKATPWLDLTAGLDFRYSGNLPLTNDLPEPYDSDGYSPFSEDIDLPVTGLGDFGFYPQVYHNTGAYLQAFLRWKRLSVLAGVRYDRHSVYDGAFNPRVAFMYRFSDRFTARASYNSGLRTPSAYYAYRSLAHKVDEGILYNTVPNPGLDPEKLQYAELGFRYDPAAWLSFDLGVFYQVLENQFTLSLAILDTAKYTGGVPGRFLVNSYINDAGSSATLYGLLLGGRAEGLVPPLYMDIDLNLSVSGGREELPNGLGTLEEVRQVPSFMGQLNLAFRPWKKVRLFARNTLSDGWVRGYLPLPAEIMEVLGYPVRVDGYYTLDLLARVQIARNFQAYFDLSNVFDAHYGGLDAYTDGQELVYNPQYGRQFRLGLVFDLK